MSPAETPLQAAQRVAPLAGACAEQIEQERALPPQLLSELRAGGLMCMCLPRELGGGEVEPAVMIEALEELARFDGASAWCAMIASTSGLLGAYLPEDEGQLIYAGGSAITGGVFAPRGWVSDPRTLVISERRAALRLGDGRLYRLRRRAPGAARQRSA